MSKSKKRVPYNQEEMEIAKQFGRSPEDAYGVREAMQDDMAMELPPLPELPAEVTAVKVEVTPESLIERLKKHLEKELAQAEKKQTEELLARLEELKAALKNAEDFLKGKEENVAAAEAAVAEALPPPPVPPPVV
jgi:LPS O-antigen subunit length determinant protein (WzzB/FepE family)